MSYGLRNALPRRRLDVLAILGARGAGSVTPFRAAEGLARPTDG